MRPTWPPATRAPPSPEPGPLSTAPGTVSVEVTDRLPAAAVAEVRALLTAALAADGVRPVSEESELRLQHGGPPGGTDLTARDADGTLVGYARLELPAGDPEAEAELVVA
ncbi:hypothetical protein DMO24_06760, partial [Modestobacter versicolor]